MRVFDEELSTTGRPAGLRTRRGQQISATAVPGAPVRLDAPPISGRKTLYFENQGPANLRWAIGTAAPASALSILTPGDFRSLLLGEDVGLYGQTTASSALVVIQQTAA